MIVTETFTFVCVLFGFGFIWILGPRWAIIKITNLRIEGTQKDYVEGRQPRSMLVNPPKVPQSVIAFLGEGSLPGKLIEANQNKQIL